MAVRGIHLVVLAAVVVACPMLADKPKAPATSGKPRPATDSLQKQPKVDPLAGLADFDVVKFEGGMTKTAWSLAIEHQQSSYPAKTAKELSTDVGSEEFFGKDTSLAQYRDALPGVVARLGLLGGELTYFLYGGEHTSAPFKVARYKDRKCFVVFVSTDTVYNTLRLSSAKQRASKLAATHGIPALRDVAKALRDTDIDVLAVFVTYGTKDFLDKSALATKPEVLGLIASKQDVLSFSEGELTDSELVAKATALVSERDETFDFTKINLNLE